VKKIKVLLSVCVIILAIGGIVGARRKNLDPFANLAPYITKDRTVYMDSTMIAGMSTSGSSSQSMSERNIELKNADPNKLYQLIHQDLPREQGWKFIASPSGLGTNTQNELFSVSLYKNPSSTMPGDADDTFYLTPDTSGAAGPFSKSAPPIPKVIGYHITSLHKMSKWETWWLKVTHFGRNPFSSPNTINP
jgi:hypothetical protein